MITYEVNTNLSNEEKAELFKIWNKEYPTNVHYKTIAEFEQYLSRLKPIKHVLALDKNNKIAGWCFVFIRDDDTWFTILVDSNFKSQGIGSTLLKYAKENLDILNGWVVDHSNYLKADGTIYDSPVNFYLKNGFIIEADVRYEYDKLSAVKMVWTRD